MYMKVIVGVVYKTAMLVAVIVIQIVIKWETAVQTFGL